MLIAKSVETDSQLRLEKKNHLTGKGMNFLSAVKAVEGNLAEVELYKMEGNLKKLRLGKEQVVNCIVDIIWRINSKSSII